MLGSWEACRKEMVVDSIIDMCKEFDEAQIT
uniref:Uncharacterized protein n=1 Tax=Oryza rufipogon TaxID=4529 RepID=A0A0E0NMJ5_ORYRU